MKSVFKQALAGLLFALTTSAMAATVDVSPSDIGWYTQPGFHSAAIKNYFASENNGQRNYFVFDVSAIDTSRVDSATFIINTYNISDAGTFTLFNVTTPASTLSASSSVGAPGQAINQDLGDGDVYGSILLNASDSNSLVSITLNSSFITALKSSSGTISLGGTFAGTTNTSAFAFGGSAINSGTLLSLNVTPVPEADKAYMMLGGLLLAGLASRRRT
jgi:hypothetical protein